jgi:hypothetical protein
MTLPEPVGHNICVKDPELVKKLHAGLNVQLFLFTSSNLNKI